MGIEHYEARDSMPKSPVPETIGLVQQRQPSKYSCIPTAFAMVIGFDVAELMDLLGHDDERGFHVQELLGIALDHGIGFVPFENDPQIEPAPCASCGGSGGVNGDHDHPCTDCCGTGSMTPLQMHLRPWEEHLAYDGVLVGRPKGTKKEHAVAWCSTKQRCLDPDGLVYALDQFDMDTFWRAHR